MEQVKGPVVLVQREASFHLGMTNEKMEGALVYWFSRRLEALKVDSDGEELNGSDIRTSDFNNCGYPSWSRVGGSLDRLGFPSLDSESNKSVFYSRVFNIYNLPLDS